MNLPWVSVCAAQRLAATVHGDGGRDDVAAILEPLERQDLLALSVTLAAMVDVEKTPRELLAWNDEPQLALRFPAGGDSQGEGGNPPAGSPTHGGVSQPPHLTLLRDDLRASRSEAASGPVGTPAPDASLHLLTQEGA